MAGLTGSVLYGSTVVDIFGRRNKAQVWATLNTTTGAITGTPQDSGSTTATLTATGPDGTSAATEVTDA